MDGSLGMAVNEDKAGFRNEFLDDHEVRAVPRILQNQWLSWIGSEPGTHFAQENDIALRQEEAGAGVIENPAVLIGSFRSDGDLIESAFLRSQACDSVGDL